MPRRAAAGGASSRSRTTSTGGRRGARRARSVSTAGGGGCDGTSGRAGATGPRPSTTGAGTTCAGTTCVGRSCEPGAAATASGPPAACVRSGRVQRHGGDLFAVDAPVDDPEPGQECQGQRQRIGSQVIHLEGAHEHRQKGQAEQQHHVVQGGESHQPSQQGPGPPAAEHRDLGEREVPQRRGLGGQRRCQQVAASPAWTGPPSSHSTPRFTARPVSPTDPKPAARPSVARRGRRQGQAQAT